MLETRGLLRKSTDNPVEAQQAPPVSLYSDKNKEVSRL